MYTERMTDPQADQPQSVPPSANPQMQTNTSWNGSATLPSDLKPPQEEVLVEWSTLSRPFKKRNRKYFGTIALFVILISLILFFAGQFLPIAAVIAVAFLVYVMEMVPPIQVTNRITTYGIRIEDSLYYWEEMGRFWFTKRYGFTLLQIEISRFPNRLTILIGDLNQEALQEMLSEVLLFGKPQPTFFEQVADRLQKLIPLE